MPVLHLEASGEAADRDGKKASLPPAQALLLRGPCVPVVVSLPQSAAKGLMASGKAVPSMQGLALIDTGATTTCIDQEAARQLGLPTIDQGEINSASHDKHPCNIHPVQITIPLVGLSVEIPRTAGVSLKSQGLVALIGRDFLSRCTLFYNGPAGSLTLPF
ncbi:MAG TPA: retroviral-like aspartic protease family protein [Terriglobales bacterium]|nr:retroviral-like aspartic protease family protein [Terriglobales bacterium]